mgnify:CR=1 FL=1
MVLASPQRMPGDAMVRLVVEEVSITHEQTWPEGHKNNERR